MKINPPSIVIKKLDSPLVIVGLGNPGENYAKTRHNAGFRLVDKLALLLGASWHSDKRTKTEIIKEGQLILIKPQTYMNLSGQAVEALMSYYKLLPKKMGFRAENADLKEKLLVIHDDLDLLLGTYRFSENSRPAGHNGVRSIIEQLKTKNFRRLRLGIRSELKEQLETKDFVLRRFSREEDEKLEALLDTLIKNFFIL